MTLDEFRKTLRDESPGIPFSPALQALWWSGKGEWDRAHTIVMAHEADRDAAWVHAYLHRVEGDLPNARYWYARAGRPTCDTPLDAEWATIAHALLVNTTSD